MTRNKAFWLLVLLLMALIGIKHFQEQNKGLFHAPETPQDEPLDPKEAIARLYLQYIGAELEPEPIPTKETPDESIADVGETEIPVPEAKQPEKAPKTPAPKIAREPERKPSKEPTPKARVPEIPREAESDEQADKSAKKAPMGTIDKYAVKELIDRKTGVLFQCYNYYRGRLDPRGDGMVKIQMQINVDGVVEHVETTENTLPKTLSDVEGCVRNQLTGGRVFPPPIDGTIYVNYPLFFAVEGTARYEEFNRPSGGK